MNFHENHESWSDTESSFGVTSNLTEDHVAKPEVRNEIKLAESEIKPEVHGNSLQEVNQSGQGMNTHGGKEFMKHADIITYGLLEWHHNCQKNWRKVLFVLAHLVLIIVPITHFYLRTRISLYNINVANSTSHYES